MSPRLDYSGHDSSSVPKFHVFTALQLPVSGRMMSGFQDCSSQNLQHIFKSMTSFDSAAFYEPWALPRLQLHFFGNGDHVLTPRHGPFEQSLPLTAWRLKNTCSLPFPTSGKVIISPRPAKAPILALKFHLYISPTKNAVLRPLFVCPALSSSLCQNFVSFLPLPLIVFNLLRVLPVIFC